MEKARDRRVFAIACSAGVAWIAFYAAWTAIGPWGSDGQRWFSNVAYHVPIVAATAIAVAAWSHGRVGSRAFWALFSLSNAIWLAAELLWSVRELSTGEVPFPWWTDAGYLGSYAVLVAAAVVAFRPSVRAVGVRELLDGALVVATLALLWWWEILRPLGLAGDGTTLVGVAYPLFGLVLLGFLAATRFVPAQRGTLTLTLFRLGILSAVGADGLYAHAAITHSYLPGDWINLGWQAEAVLFTLAGVAALRVDTRSEWARWRSPSRLGSIGIATVGALAVAAVLVVDSRDGLALATAVATGAVAALCLARTIMLVRDRPPAGELRDAASGAYLPACFLEVAERHVRRARHLREDFALALFDLGERAADPAARRIVQAAGSLDAVGRLDERRLAALLALTGEERAASTAERLRAAGGWDVSAGVAVWEEPDELETLIERAQALLDAATRLGGGHTRGPEPDLLLRGGHEIGVGQFEQLLERADAIDARYVLDGAHSRKVARVAREIGIALDLDPEDVRLCYLGGLLHAFGRLSFSGEELRPGLMPVLEDGLPLQHAQQGAEIVRRIPCARDAAPVVAAHQEHWDGSGSPRGLQGEQIPVAARVVAVADALVTLTTAEAQQPRTLTSALTEMWRFAGVRYDPAVVSALFRLVRAGELTELDAEEARVRVVAACESR